MMQRENQLSLTEPRWVCKPHWRAGPVPSSGCQHRTNSWYLCRLSSHIFLFENSFFLTGLLLVFLWFQILCFCGVYVCVSCGFFFHFLNTVKKISLKTHFFKKKLNYHWSVSAVPLDGSCPHCLPSRLATASAMHCFRVLRVTLRNLSSLCRHEEITLPFVFILLRK